MTSLDQAVSALARTEDGDRAVVAAESSSVAARRAAAALLVTQRRLCAEERATYDRWAWPVIGLYALMAACLLGGAIVSSPPSAVSAVATFDAAPPYP